MLKYYSKKNTKNNTNIQTTHLSIVAHQDDAEFMSYHGILKCYKSKKKKFGVIVCSNGSGSTRNNSHSDSSDSEFIKIRNKEQIKAAKIGKYSFAYLLNHPSSKIKDNYSKKLLSQLEKLIIKYKPKIIYTHNPADKHQTHVSVLAHVIKTLRKIKNDENNNYLMPKKLYGCEMWRSLDWINDKKKIILDHSGRKKLETSLNSTFISQISAGKKYDKAIKGRRIANATFLDPNSTDKYKSVTYAIDMKILIKKDNLSINQYIQKYINKLSKEITNNLKKFS